MNKLLVITVLVALLAINAESFRVVRQVDEEEVTEGTLTKLTGIIRNNYDSLIDKASGYLDSVRGLKLEEKAKNMYHDTTKAASTYFGVLSDQLYYIIYPQH